MNFCIHLISNSWCKLGFNYGKYGGITLRIYKILEINKNDKKKTTGVNPKGSIYPRNSFLYAMCLAEKNSAQSR